MRIVTIVRTRDDEAIIERFVRAYQKVSDLTIVADGGSTDRTVEIVESFPRTKVLPFDKRQPVDNDMWINPQGEHLDFLIEAAKEEGADWIIFDDSDCVPNFILRWQIRERFELANFRGQSSVFVRRVYFWGPDRIFPKLHEPNTSLYAWQPDVPISGERSVRHLQVNGAHEARANAMHLEFPYCLLHYPWPDDETAQKKTEWYRKTGVQPAAQHPIQFGGPLEYAEWFMAEKPPEVEKVE